MFQGRGMALRGQRIPCLHPLASHLHLLPHRRLTFRPLCLFVRPFVCLFGWLLHCLSAPCCRHPIPIASPHHVVALHLVVVPLISSSLSLRVVASCLASSLPSRHRTSTLMPSSLIFLSWLDALVAHLPLMARCLLGDVYECICFGLVTVKECVNFRLVTCHRTVLKFGKK